MGKRTQNGKNSCESISSYMMKIDSFGEDKSFTVRDGDRYYRTWLGTLLTLLIYGVIVVYGMNKY